MNAFEFGQSLGEKTAVRGGITASLLNVAGLGKQIKPFLNNGVPARGRARASELAAHLSAFRNSPAWAKRRDAAVLDKSRRPGSFNLTPLILGEQAAPSTLRLEMANNLRRVNRPYAAGGGSVLQPLMPKMPAN